MRPFHAALSIMVILLFGTLGFAYTNVSTCQAINAPGEYRVNETLYGVFVSSSCLYITSSDVLLDCQNNMLYKEGTGTDAIKMAGTLHNITVKNCHVKGNTTVAYTYAIHAYQKIENSSIINNTIERTGAYSIYLQGSGAATSVRNFTVSNNTIKDGNYGIYLTYAVENLIENNNISNHTNVNINVASNSPDNTITGNEISVKGDGVVAISDNQTIENNYIHDNPIDRGIRVTTACNNTKILNNNLSNIGIEGISTYVCENVTIAHNRIDNANQQGIDIESLTFYSDVYNNTVSNSNIGIEVNGNSANNSIYNNTVFNNANRGFHASSAYDNNFTNNTAHGHAAGASTMGFYINGTAVRNRFENNMAYNNSNGFYLSSSASGNVLINNTACNSTATGYGLRFDTTTGENEVRDMEIYNNYYGVYVYRGKANLTDSHIYNSSHQDFYVSMSTVAYNISLNNVIFDSPAGDYQNFTNLTLLDEVYLESYYINWATMAAPAGNQSFGGKWIEITKGGSNPMSIDKIVWHWRGDEVTGNESELDLYKYNSSGWFLVNDTPDTVAHTLTLYNHDPKSTYGILQPLQTGLHVTSSGVYNLGNDFTGADIGVSGIPGITGTAILISSDNVVVDCNGYNITNDGSANAAAIVINGSASVNYTNVTIRNCPFIAGYEVGVYVMNSDDDIIQNLTLFNNTDGIVLNQTGNSHVQNNNVTSSTGTCIATYSSAGVNVDNNYVGSCGTGFSFDNAFDHDVNDNQATGSAANGFDLPNHSEDNTFDNNDAWDNGEDGFHEEQGTNNTFANNNAWNNTGDGFASEESENSTYDGNEAQENGVNGFDLQNATGDDINNNNASANGATGFDLPGANGNSVDNNNAWDNGEDGFAEEQGQDNTFANNNAWNNDEDGYSFDGTQDDEFIDNEAEENQGNGVSVNLADRFFADPSWFCNNTIGIFVNNSNNTVIEDSVACNNTQYGIYVLNSDNTTINGTSRTYNNALDFLVNNTLGSPITLNVTSLKFDNPAGDGENATILRFYDTVAAGSAFSISWTAQPGAALSGYVSFWNRFVDLSSVAGSVSIDSISWTWTDSEAIYGGYDETKLFVHVWNGSSWSDTGATLNTVANTLTLTSYTPASEYGMFHNGTAGVPTNLYGAVLSNITPHGRFNNNTAQSNPTEGGNITGVAVSSAQLTEKWAAFYGDVVGGIVLRGATGSNYVYSWAWNATNGGVVCVSTNSSITTFVAYPANGSSIDSAWSFLATDADSASNTFNSTNCTLDIGSSTVNNASYADTGAAGGFMTCAVKTTGSAPTKPDMIFCSEIIAGGTAWDGSSANFELMVPTPAAPGATETYYFYANLD